MTKREFGEGERNLRKHPRAGWKAEAVLQCSGREYILAARNISEGGMGVQSQSDLAMQASGFVSFQLREGLPLACRCRVVYSIDGKGTGIEFLELSDETRWVLRDFIKTIN